MTTDKYSRSINNEGNIFIHVRDKGVDLEIKEFNHKDSYIIKLNKCFNVTLNTYVSEQDSKLIIRDFLKEEFCLEDVEMNLLSETTKLIHSVPLLTKEEISTFDVDNGIKEIEYEYLISNVSFQCYYYNILLKDIKSKGSQLFNMDIDFDYSKGDIIYLRYKDMSVSLCKDERVTEDWCYWKINTVFLKRNNKDRIDIYLKLHELYENLGLHGRGILDGDNLIFDVSGYSFIIRKDDIHIPHIKKSKVIVLNEEVSKELSNLSKIITLSEGGSV